MIRFAIKAGMAAGAVYYLKEEGIWKESSQSLKTYDKLNTALQPYVAEVKKQIPFELPEVPDSARTSETARLYWNKGVMSTFQFLSELPNRLGNWTRKGINTILANPDIKNLIEAAPEKPPSK